MSYYAVNIQQMVSTSQYCLLNLRQKYQQEHLIHSAANLTANQILRPYDAG